MFGYKKTERERKIARMAALNDRLRETFWGGQIFMSQWVMKLPPKELQQVFTKVQNYDDFTPDNNPHGERDFGKFRVGDNEVIWKIDYYDLRREFMSPDPSDPDVTQRVLTIMLADEY